MGRLRRRTSRVSVAVGEAHAVADDDGVLGPGLDDGRADLGQQALAEHAQQVEAGQSRSRLQVGGGAAAKLQHGQRFVDHHADRSIAAQQRRRSASRCTSRALQWTTPLVPPMRGAADPPRRPEC